MRFRHETRCVREFVVSVVSAVSLKTPQTPRTLSHISFHAEISWDLTNRHHILVSVNSDHEIVVSISHHFYIISVANRSQKIANLWKPVTSLIMVRFSIRKKFWKALGVLYQSVVSISQISRDFGMKRDVWESSWWPQTPRTLLHISFHAEISWDFTKRHHILVSVNSDHEIVVSISLNSHEISFYVMWLTYQPIRML